MAAHAGRGRSPMLTTFAVLAAGSLSAYGITRRGQLWGIGVPMRSPVLWTVLTVGAAGVLPAIAVFEDQPWWALVLWAGALAAGADLVTREIPHRFVAIMVVVGVVELVMGRLQLWPTILAALAIAAFFLLVHLISGAGLGLGDVKLAAGLALALGWPGALTATVLGLWAAGLFAAVLLISRRMKRSEGIPLGPFLVLGAAIAMLAAVPFQS